MKREISRRNSGKYSCLGMMRHSVHVFPRHGGGGRVVGAPCTRRIRVDGPVRQDSARGCGAPGRSARRGNRRHHDLRLRLWRVNRHVRRRVVELRSVRHVGGPHLLLGSPWKKIVQEIRSTIQEALIFSYRVNSLPEDFRRFLSKKYTNIRTNTTSSMNKFSNIQAHLSRLESWKISSINETRTEFRIILLF